MLLGIDSPTDIRSDRGRNNVWLSKRLEIDQDNLVLIYCIGLEVQLLGLTESLTMVLHLSLCPSLLGSTCNFHFEMQSSTAIVSSGF